MEIQTFYHEDFGKIRAAEIDGERWMLWADFAEKIYSPGAVENSFHTTAGRYISDADIRKEIVPPSYRPRVFINRRAFLRVKDKFESRRLNRQKINKLCNWILTGILNQKNSD